jgi:hypothetical protein
VTNEQMIEAIEAAEQRRREAGEDPALASIVLSVPLKREPKNFDRAQVVPGLFGRCVGWSGAGNVYVMDVKTADIRAYLRRRAAAGGKP